jgi:hypothetical protein
MKLLKPAFLMLAVAFGSCGKDNILKYGKPSGIFKGNFTSYASCPQCVITTATRSGDVTVKFSGNTFQSTGNSNYIPAGGEGKFTVQGNQIIFTDQNVHTANFDWNLVLNGTYDSQIKTDTLVLEKVVNIQHYKYILVKQ